MNSNSKPRKYISEYEFKRIFDEYYHGLLRYVYSYTKDFQEAENIVQDVFVVLWRKKDIIEPDSDVRGFLIRTAKLTTWNHLRARRRKLTLSKDIHEYEAKELDIEIKTLDFSSESLLYTKEIDDIIQKTLNAHPKLTQEIFLLSRVDLLSYKEIAEKMNLSTKSVEYHISKVLSTLKENLAPYGTYLWILYFLK